MVGPIQLLSRNLPSIRSGCRTGLPTASRQRRRSYFWTPVRVALLSAGMCDLAPIFRLRTALPSAAAQTITPTRADPSSTGCRQNSWSMPNALRSCISLVSIESASPATPPFCSSAKMLLTLLWGLHIDGAALGASAAHAFAVGVEDRLCGACCGAALAV
jgi:hypothetical protein